MHCEFARWARGCDLDQYRSAQGAGRLCCRPRIFGGSRLWLPGDGVGCAVSAVGDMSMLASTVWYMQLAVSPSIVRKRYRLDTYLVPEAPQGA
eukprot:2020530-Prymnesium_polylepis.1